MKAAESFDSNQQSVDTITFNLFTQQNPTRAQILILNSTSSVLESNWLSSRPTRFVTHGWVSNQNSDSCVVVRNAYLTAGDYNVIVVDWGKIADALYPPAMLSVRRVAARIAEFIDFLHIHAGLDYANTKLIGHSLGGHIAGLAARGASGNIQGVISLDPALPGFETAGPGYSVHPTDADHVQVIHTNGGRMGLMRTAGDSDYYPNGGRSQPGCGRDLLGSCAHARAVYFLAESILNPTGFRATGTRSEDLQVFDPNVPIFMGGRVLSTATGSFTLETAAQAPYALG